MSLCCTGQNYGLHVQIIIVCCLRNADSMGAQRTHQFNRHNINKVYSIPNGYRVISIIFSFLSGPHDFVADRTITIVKKTSCGMCPVLEENEIYILIGRMGPKRTDPQGNTRYVLKRVYHLEQ